MKILKFFVISFCFMVFLTGCTIPMSEGSHPPPNQIVLIKNQSQVELGLIENGYVIGKIMPRQTFPIEKTVLGSGSADYVYELIPYRVNMWGEKIFMSHVKIKVRMYDSGPSVKSQMFIVKDDGMCNFSVERVDRGSGW